MARRVVWTETAANDLEQAAEYIALDSPRYAAAFVREARAAARTLSDHAERGRMVPEFGDRAIRELFVRNYPRIYRLTPDAVSIIGFIHGARELSTLWEREGRSTSDEPQ